MLVFVMRVVSVFCCEWCSRDLVSFLGLKLGVGCIGFFGLGGCMGVFFLVKWGFGYGLIYGEFVVFCGIWLYFSLVCIVW